MTDDNLDTLLRTTNNTAVSLEQSKKFTNTKRKMNGICKALTLETKKYVPQMTVENIQSYIVSTSKLDRILYSEISNYVFSLEMVIKLYDHFQLAWHQIENANNIFANSIEEAKETLQKQIKGVGKEYISILGIFAAIVLAFVGGITFSTSVLQNISAVSVFRLLLVVDFLAFILINIIYILVKFIFTINEKDAKLFNIKALNITCLVIVIVILIAWLLNANEMPDFISQFLPWSK